MFNANFDKNVRTCRLPLPGNVKLKLPIIRRRMTACGLNKSQVKAKRVN
jgi:hypothetical protein